MTADSELRYASSPRIGLEIAMLEACRDEIGESGAALAERIAELEIKIGELPQIISLMQSAVLAAKPAESAETQSKIPTAKPEPEQDRKTVPPQGEKIADTKTMQTENLEPSQSDAEIWTAALKLLTETEPAITAILRRERFIGQSQNVFRVQVPAERKNFSYLNLKRPGNMDSISSALSSAAGRPVRFEVLLEGAESRQADVSESIRMLADTVGRDLLQIDESEE